MELRRFVDFLAPLLCFLGYLEGTTDNQLSNQATIHEYCIVGAGPAGLQLGYFLQQTGRDYVIYDKADRPGSFYQRYPRHRMLISINKRFTGRKNRLFNERHDWNSLLSHDDSLRFPLYSKEFFPHSVAKLSFVFCNYFGRDDRCSTPFQRFVGPMSTLASPAGVLIVATGWSKPYRLRIPGSEYMENYSDFDVNPRKYEGKSVLIIGRGAPRTGSYRDIWRPLGVNNAIVDTYQLKSLDGLLEGDINRFKLIRKNGKIYVTPDFDGQYNTANLLRVKPDGENAIDNFPLRLPYDHVIACLGFVVDGSIFHKLSLVSLGKVRVWLKISSPESCRTSTSIVDEGPNGAQILLWKVKTSKDCYRRKYYSLEYFRPNRERLGGNVPGRGAEQ
ncbi:unnamed protein product [Darwinula stevensoni]|uniref:FAD/NAD(P)-binding domain-containing protein n=1 Tax=Darwinula stevensoni TaxID=69355 RepID=A0A7R9AEC0_9CRUS|nr:unnamed protein product [Darwinula stevensoni]CAG0902198.1 unnamed protein product [Darwinula stevensoni]